MERGANRLECGLVGERSPGMGPWIHPSTGKERGGRQTSPKTTLNLTAASAKKESSREGAGAYSKQQKSTLSKTQKEIKQKGWGFGSGEIQSKPGLSIQAPFSKREEEKKTTYTKSTHEPLLRGQCCKPALLQVPETTVTFSRWRPGSRGDAFVYHVGWS